MSPTIEQLEREAREHFVRWIEFYLEAFPEEAGSQEQLAKRLGISAVAISLWRRKGSTRYPSVKNLVRFQALISRVYRVTLDTLLFSDPPTIPRR